MKHNTPLLPSSFLSPHLNVVICPKTVIRQFIEPQCTERTTATDNQDFSVVVAGDETSATHGPDPRTAPDSISQAEEVTEEETC